MTKCSRCGKSHTNTWKDLSDVKHPFEYCKPCEKIQLKFLKRVLE